MRLPKIFALILLIAITHQVMAQNSIPKFKEGERVVFVGNSITHGGHYHSFIWLYYITQFPDMPITIMNAGIGGDTAWDIEERLEQDVFSKHPTYMTMTFGMNDVGYFDFYKDNAQEIAAKQIKRSFESFQKIEERMQEASDVTKVLIGGSPYDETSKIENQIFPTKDAALQKVIDFQKKSAAKNNWGFVDFHGPMLEINQREQAKDSLFALCGGDRIHPDNNGHMVMAYLFLKAQGMIGNKVADIEIDGRKKETVKSDNCFISDVKSGDDQINFMYLAKALPYPMDSIPKGWGSKNSQKDACKLLPIMEDINQEQLKVTNLKKGYYNLVIDGIKIKRFSNEELQNGINMAECENTPQYMQAYKILLLNEERFEIEKRFRDYAWMNFSFLQDKGLALADNKAALDSITSNWENGFIRGNFGAYERARNPEIRKIWQKQMDDIVSEMYELAQPKLHKIELIRVN
nr:SGNH/GDSL hydrolase family protein [uncultured Carboxylicivirga sp.]